MSDERQGNKRDAILREFEAAARERGLILNGPPEADGEFHRVSVKGDKPGKESGSYRLSLDGAPRGFIQNYREGGGVNWRPSDVDSFTLTAEERSADAQRQRDRMAERAAKQEERAAWVSEEWRRLPVASDDHAYLARKGVVSHGLKVDRHGNLVMPLIDIEGKLWSVQRISADGNKLFTKDGRTLACFSPVGADDPKKPIVVAEGYATSASIYEITGLPVVCALNAGNLRPVAEAFRQKFPDRPILIAGDNDHMKEAAGKPNVGKEASLATAEAVGGHVLLPTFASDDAGTDWNDLAASRGRDTVREQVDALLSTLSIAMPAAPDLSSRPAPFEPSGATVSGVQDGRTYLVVPYRDREDANALGAKWDRARKQWYVPRGVDLAAFERWPRADVAVTVAQNSAAPATTPSVATGPISSAPAQRVQPNPPLPPRDEQLGRAFRAALQSIAASTNVRGDEVTRTIALDTKVEAVYHDAWRRTGSAGAGDRAVGEMIRTGQGFAGEAMPAQAAAALEKIRAEFGLPLPAPEPAAEPAAPVGAESTPAAGDATIGDEPGTPAPDSAYVMPEWAADQMQFWRDLADRRGLTERIEREFADGKTLAEVQRSLGDAISFVSAEERGVMLANVRLSLGIPSRMSEEGAQEFIAWKQAYDARQAEPRDSAADGEQPIVPTANDDTRVEATMWDVAADFAADGEMIGEPRPATEEQISDDVVAATTIGRAVGQTRLDHARREQAAAENDLPLSADDFDLASDGDARLGTSELFERLGVRHDPRMPLTMALVDAEWRIRSALTGQDAPLDAETHAQAVNWVKWLAENRDSRVRDSALGVALALGRHDDVFGETGLPNPFEGTALASAYHLGREREVLGADQAAPDRPVNRQRFEPMFETLSVNGEPGRPMIDVLAQLQRRVEVGAERWPLDEAAREQLAAWLTWVNRSAEDPAVREATLSVARMMGQYDNAKVVNDVPFRDPALLDAYREGWNSVKWSASGWTTNPERGGDQRPMPGLRERPELRESRSIGTVEPAAAEGNRAPVQVVGDTPVAGDTVSPKPSANEPSAKNPANEPIRPVGERVAPADLDRVRQVRSADADAARATLDEARAQQQSAADEAARKKEELTSRLRAKPFGTPAGGTATPQPTPARDRESNEIEIGDGVEKKPILTASGYDLPASVAERYVVKEGKFWKPNLRDPNADGSDVPHIEDKGPRLASHANDRGTIADMLAIAQAKSWTSVTVKGSPEFRRNAWLEAKLAGIDVHGYKPSDSDHALLEAARREQARQRDALTIRKGEPPAPAATKPAPSDAASAPATTTTISRNPEPATTAPRGVTTPEEKAIDTLTGVLLEHGAARYQHKPDTSYSYYVRYRDDVGEERTVWGVDLKRAMSESGAQIGDTVSLKNKGETPVSVEQEVRDDTGKVIGTEWKGAIRNEWNVSVAAPAEPERGPAPAPQTVGQLREQFEKSLAGYPARTREEMLNRFDASVKVALEVERKVAAGELKATDAGGAIDANFADLKKQWTAPAPRQAPAPAPGMQQTPKVGI
ncbi:toprim domain-containing protein (plasmid) [Burkholderia sp. MS455]|uniref:LPD7 domain-containing protein n=1 Tax=Burkholderia sp. MS455 TaxID=2811788 RepID=UPI0019592425|nr:LPD7 domain-containing protein [Burkholderia sp. MS455]QRR11811.1 toprim domain-containing protein [Burkholderia sp. MS455]